MEEPVEPPVNHVELLRNACEAEIIIDDIVEELLIRGADVLFDHYLDGKNDPFIVKQKTNILLNAIEQMHIRRDNGEAEVWPEEEELVPCPIDTWGRAAVPIRKKFRMVQTRPPTSPHREGSSKSLMSSIARASQAFKAKIGPSTPMHTTGLEEVRSFTPIPLPEQKVVVSAVEDKLRLSKEAEVMRRFEEEERIRKANQAEEDRIKEAAKRAQELRDKPFTYDYEGRIMLLRPLHETGANGDTEYQVAIDAPPNPKGKKQLGRVPSRKELPTLKQKKAPVNDVEFVKNVQSGQPPLFDNIKLTPGVKIGEGNRFKTSPHRQKNRTLSRGQYRRLAESPGLLMTQSSFASSIKSSKHETKDGAKNEALKSQVMTSNPELLSEIPDIEDEERFEASVNPNPRKSKSVRQLAPITKFGEEVEEEEGMSEVDQFNFKILKSTNWGSNPPIREPILPTRMPKRPSNKSLQETHGFKIKLPRDRPYIESTTSRSHMPPPPIGKTMGHGLLHVQSEYLASLQNTSRKAL